VRDLAILSSSGITGHILNKTQTIATKHKQAAIKHKRAAIKHKRAAEDTIKPCNRTTTLPKALLVMAKQQALDDSIVDTHDMSSEAFVAADFPRLQMTPSRLSSRVTRSPK
jgi:hypothetical protein